jgi:hypothetical protein
MRDALLLWTDAAASMQARRQSRAKVKRNIPPRSGLRSREISRDNQFTGFRREPRIERIATGQRCGEEAEGQENAMKQGRFV